MQPSTLEKEINLNLSKCPHCGAKLGNFLYADACPHCHVELKHNTAPRILTPKKDPHLAQPWFARIFFRIVRLVES